MNTRLESACRTERVSPRSFSSLLLITATGKRQERSGYRPGLLPGPPDHGILSSGHGSAHDLLLIGPRPSLCQTGSPRIAQDERRLGDKTSDTYLLAWIGGLRSHEANESGHRAGRQAAT